MFLKSFCTVFLLISTLFATAQEKSGRTYHLNKKIDFPLTAVGLGATYFGFQKIAAKPDITDDELYALDKNDLPGIDRGAAGRWNQNAADLSEPPFYGAFVFGAVLLADKAVRSEVGTIGLMYLQSLAISSGIYASVQGTVKRMRPLTYQDYSKHTVDEYNELKDMDLRGNYNRNSFFGGHPVIPATTTFFVAKVYHDRHPGDNFQYVLWGFAGATTLYTASLRYIAGKHFPTDLITGVTVGVLSGVLVPEFHKKKPKEGGFSMIPLLGQYQGLAMNYSF